MSEKENKKGRVGTVIGIVLCVLLIPILLVNVTMIVKSLVNPSKVPSVFGYSPLIVLTDSMYPEIKSGDLIIVKSAEPEEVQVGDVIAFFDPDGNGVSVLTHRVVSINTSGAGLSFQTKGDANNAEDLSPAPAGSLIGVYRAKIPGAGNVAMFLQSTLGLIVCVAVPLLLLVAYELIRRKKYEKGKNEDTKALLAELEALRAMKAEQETKSDALPQPEPEQEPAAETSSEPEPAQETKPEQASEKSEP